jgi:hypothetical protein
MNSTTTNNKLPTIRHIINNTRLLITYHKKKMNDYYYRLYSNTRINKFVEI